MKITFTAFDGKQFETMEECMEYEANQTEVEVRAYMLGEGIIEFHEYGDQSLQWEECCSEYPPILWFKDKEMLDRYIGDDCPMAIQDIKDYTYFCNFWCYDDEENTYFPYDKYICILKCREDEARSIRKDLEKQYEKMRQM